MRAFGLLLRDIAERTNPAATMTLSESTVSLAAVAAQAQAQAHVGGGHAAEEAVVAELRGLAARCVDLAPAERPRFAQVCGELSALQARLAAAAAAAAKH